MNKIIATVFVFLLTGCGPSCEERGGAYVQDGYIYIWHTVGNVQWMQPYPNMVCVIKDNK